MQNHKCGYCLKSFTRLRDVKRHTKVHGKRVKDLVWQVGDELLKEGLPHNNTRDHVRYKAAILAHRARFSVKKPENRSFFKKYASWLTDSPPNYKVRLRYTKENEKRKLNFKANRALTYACMFSQAQQMTENQFRFMHSDRVSHINETWQHFVQKNLKRIPMPLQKRNNDTTSWQYRALAWFWFHD